MISEKFSFDLDQAELSSFIRLKVTDKNVKWCQRQNGNKIVLSLIGMKPAFWCIKLFIWELKGLILFFFCTFCFFHTLPEAASTWSYEYHGSTSQCNTSQCQSITRPFFLQNGFWHHFTFSSVTFKRIKLQSSAWSRSKENFSEIIFLSWKKLFRSILTKLWWVKLDAIIIS